MIATTSFVSTIVAWYTTPNEPFPTTLSATNETVEPSAACAEPTWWPWMPDEEPAYPDDDDSRLRERELRCVGHVLRRARVRLGGPGPHERAR